MWTCPKCTRVFEKKSQIHSCHQVPLEFHFKNKDQARDLFDYLVNQINNKIGQCKIISIPCCIHIFGHYDFLAVLPKKDSLEIRFALNHPSKNSRITNIFALSKINYKNCLSIKSIKDIDNQLLTWLEQSYFLKDDKKLGK